MPTATKARPGKPRKATVRQATRRPNAPPSGHALSNKVYAPRLQRVTRAVASALSDSAWILLTSPADVAYVTGFLGGDSYLLLPARAGTRGVIISDFRYDEELAPQRSMFDVHIRSGSMWAAVGDLLGERSIRECGFQAEHVSVADKGALDKQAARSGITLRETTGVLSALRLVKDDHEVGLIRGAIKIQEAALKAVLPLIKPGMSELDLAASLEAEMKRRGSSTPAFESIVAARANGSLPHYRPGKPTLAKGQPLLIDWGAVNTGYRGDMTRTFHLGPWSRQMADIYDIVLEAHERAAAGLRSGASSKAIDALARDFIASKGFGKQFGHGLGHGLGLHTHEGPRLHHMATLDEPLKAGMVVTIEPGIYLPGIGGVRIEDNYLVTEKGSTNLSSLPKSRAWSTL